MVSHANIMLSISALLVCSLATRIQEGELTVALEEEEEEGSRAAANGIAGAIGAALPLKGTQQQSDNPQLADAHIRQMVTTPTVAEHNVSSRDVSRAEDNERQRLRAAIDMSFATKEEMMANFKPIEGEIADADWCGELKDLFSPDDKNPDSRRFIDLLDGDLCISADTGGEKWGKKFGPESTVNPTLSATDQPNTRKTNFESKIPADAPEEVKKEVANGALSFTVVMGTSMGKKVLKFPGLYDGKGGHFTPAGDVPASDCDNFWEYVSPAGSEKAMAVRSSLWQAIFAILFATGLGAARFWSSSTLC